jgi:hypothetical protein
MLKKRIHGIRMAGTQGELPQIGIGRACGDEGLGKRHGVLPFIL